MNRFREYATRISFNLSLSRNQIGHIAGMVAEIEHINSDYDTRTKADDEACLAVGGNPRLFIPANKSLLAMGLVEHDPRWEAENERLDNLKPGEPRIRRYWGPHLRFTPAGEHVVELLRIAGLIPRAAANTSQRQEKVS